MLIVGLVETGPDVYQLQLLAETGEIVEYTVSKNDKNLSDLSYWEPFSKTPIGVPVFFSVRSLRSLPLHGAMLCDTALTGALEERARSASGSVAIIANDSQ